MLQCRPANCVFCSRRPRCRHRIHHLHLAFSASSNMSTPLGMLVSLPWEVRRNIWLHVTPQQTVVNLLGPSPICDQSLLCRYEVERIWRAYLRKLGSIFHLNRPVREEVLAFMHSTITIRGCCPYCLRVWVQHTPLFFRSCVQTIQLCFFPSKRNIGHWGPRSTQWHRDLQRNISPRIFGARPIKMRVTLGFDGRRVVHAQVSSDGVVGARL